MLHGLPNPEGPGLSGAQLHQDPSQRSGVFHHILFYLSITQDSARPQYILYAVLLWNSSTTIGVGVVYFREPFNIYHMGAVILALLAIALYSYGQYVAKI